MTGTDHRSARSDRRRRRSRAVLLAALAFTLATVATAAESLETLLARSRYTETERGDVRAAYSTAEAEGIPAELLLPRLAEANAKRVPAAAFLDALRRQSTALIDARRLLEEADANALARDEASWARAATLLLAGVSGQAVQELAAAWASSAPGGGASAPPVDRLPAFRFAGALLVSAMDWGLEESEALALAVAAVRSVLPLAEYEALVGVLAEGRTARVRPQEMVRRIEAALSRVRSIRELKRLVL